MLESAEVSFASLADTEMGQNHKQWYYVFVGFRYCVLLLVRLVERGT